MKVAVTYKDRNTFRMKQDKDGVVERQEKRPKSPCALNLYTYSFREGMNNGRTARNQ